MSNLWPESFYEKEIISPKEIIEEQAKYLPQLTSEMVYAKVEEPDKETLIYNDLDGYPFNFQFSIEGKFLGNYKFKVFILSHDINIYPFYLIIDSEIAKELKIDDKIQIDDQEKFIYYLEAILKSNKLRNIIGSIIKLSK